ncbi:unnamed protein product [Phyllotreta striolata]|uniref:Uncharacterized protein n=1 Tax=Phyllotreta striolata TaxID=444603 RepID=A0A9N9TUQ1_PHYSR|nr:unnamed protein product [Phyllotreta striolata]
MCTPAPCPVPCPPTCGPFPPCAPCRPPGCNPMCAIPPSVQAGLPIPCVASIPAPSPRCGPSAPIPCYGTVECFPTPPVPCAPLGQPSTPTSLIYTATVTCVPSPVAYPCPPCPPCGGTCGPCGGPPVSATCPNPCDPRCMHPPFEPY